jgi:hypothetical protein
MTLSPPGASGQYALFYLYILMKNISHFGYRDEFSACLSVELQVPTEENRAAFYQHILSLLAS